MGGYVKNARKGEVSMVAPRSAEQTGQVSQLEPVETLAERYQVPRHALAGMCRRYGWAEGKQVSAAEFEAAAMEYRTRPMGSR